MGSVQALQADILALFGMRTFGSLWYWVTLAVVWTTSSHWTLGVPFGMLLDAARGDRVATRRVSDIARARAVPLAEMAQGGGVWLFGVLVFLVTMLGLMGGLYRIEPAMGAVLILGPIGAVWTLNARLAVRIRTGRLDDAELVEALMRRRARNQLIGLVAVSLSVLVAVARAMLLRTWL